MALYTAAMLGRRRALSRARHRFAEGLRQTRGLRSEALVRAFARVPRESFLPAGPWLLLESSEGYASTPDADPVRLYRDVAVGIDPGRLLNNSQPGLMAVVIEALGIAPGSRVAHVGCATGYYTAILAQLVGRRGRVRAFEIDPRICQAARRNLRGWRQVEVVHGDALELDPGPADAILVDAGVTHPAPAWLDALVEGGRLSLPLTAVRPPSRVARFLKNNLGRILVVTRGSGGFAARFGDGLGVAALYGGRDPERQAGLEAAYRAGGFEQVRSVRREPHVPEDACWFHSDGFCLSRRAVGEPGESLDPPRVRRPGLR
jgi:protein-L-isoaspartate(D-aspartate) O-methyltransferase